MIWDIIRNSSGPLTMALMLIAGISKVTGQTPMRDTAAHFGIPWERYRMIGFAELAAVVGILIGFWVPVLGVVTGAAVVALMIGAIVVHLRSSDPFTELGSAVVTWLFSTAYLVAQTVIMIRQF
ncbi:DoxX family protein [Propionibacteriaceae bacterium Y2011]|uniref:DoxX family protein n=1 Tax=Microlunatus sp. Y2014 TaxID=3418488 RepID=UPI003B494304